MSDGELAEALLRATCKTCGVRITVKSCWGARSHAALLLKDERGHDRMLTLRVDGDLAAMQLGSRAGSIVARLLASLSDPRLEECLAENLRDIMRTHELHGP